MAKNEIAPKGGPKGDSAPMENMTAEDAAVAIQRATDKTPHLAILRDKLIQAIEKSDGGMESLVRVIRSKLHE